jgi:serine/threonine-protein kinase
MAPAGLAAEPQLPGDPPHEPPVAIVPARPRRSRRGPALLAVALVLALAAGLGAYWFGWARYTATPGVIGLTQQAATTKLHHAGLDVRVGAPSYSEDVAKGLVMSTDPDPGSRVPDHGTVTLTVSLGKERYAVPRLARLSVDQAQDALRRQHLAYGRSILRYDDAAPKGMVIASDPGAGRREPPGFQVDLVVSRGPQPIHVQDWTGRSADLAIRVLQRQQLQVDTSRREYSDTVAAGHVLAQTPGPGQVLHAGDTVSLTVSKGPELVQVPGDLPAEGVQAATDELTALGFKVRVEHSEIYLGLGYVADSEPSPGSMARKGSIVILKVV